MMGEIKDIKCNNLTINPSFTVFVCLLLIFLLFIVLFVCFLPFSISVMWCCPLMVLYWFYLFLILHYFICCMDFIPFTCNDLCRLFVWHIFCYAFSFKLNLVLLVFDLTVDSNVLNLNRWTKAKQIMDVATIHPLTYRESCTKPGGGLKF